MEGHLSLVEATVWGQECTQDIGQATTWQIGSFCGSPSAEISYSKFSAFKWSVLISVDFIKTPMRSCARDGCKSGPSIPSPGTTTRTKAFLRSRTDSEINCWRPPSCPSIKDTLYLSKCTPPFWILMGPVPFTGLCSFSSLSITKRTWKSSWKHNF